MTNRFLAIGDRTPTYAINLDQRKDSEYLTVPVIGIPRGGTTLVASVLHAIGIHMGPLDDLMANKFEDQGMTTNDPFTLMNGIVSRDSEHARWGWKDPTAINTVIGLLSHLRNPHVILVLRDPLASVQGEIRIAIEGKYTPRAFKDLMACTASWIQGNLDFIRTSTVPTLIVSYERAMTNPSAFVQELVNFLGIQVNKQHRDKATQCIGPRGGYLITDKAWETKQ